MFLPYVNQLFVVYILLLTIRLCVDFVASRNSVALNKHLNFAILGIQTRDART